MKSATRCKTQDVQSKLQEVRNRKQYAQQPSAAFIQAFVEDRRPATDEEIEDAAWVTQMMEWLTAPRAPASAEVVRRVITRVQCIV